MVELRRYGLVFVMLLCSASIALAHGFTLTIQLSPSGQPIAIDSMSESSDLDIQGDMAGPDNLFFDQWSASSTTNSSGTFFKATEGFAARDVPWPAYTATYTILSPLYFSDGSNTTAAASPAAAGTRLKITNRFVGTYPGAADNLTAPVQVTGTSGQIAGYGVSLYDPHELEKDLYLAAGTTQTYGEYGFAYQVVVSFAGGPTLKTVPLVDVFAMSSPTLGDYADSAAPSTQDAATQAIYYTSQKIHIWNGGSSTSWSSAANWNYGVAGATTGSSSGDTLLFNANPTNRTPTVDTNRNIMNVTFDTASVGPIALGSAGGAALLVSSGGSIVLTARVTNPQVVNCPLFIQGSNGIYTVTNNATSSSATASLGGAINAAGAGSAIFTLDGSNSGSNVVSGAIGNGSATSIALLKTGSGNWTLSGANSFSGGVTVQQGALSASQNGNLGAVSGGIKLDGGTLRATGDLIASARSLTVTANGGTIDTGINTVTLGGATAIAGTFTKLGGGTLTLAGSQSNAPGALLLANEGAINVNSNLGGNVSVRAKSIVNFSASQTLANLTLLSGSLVTLTTDTPQNIAPGQHLLVTPVLNIADAALDLANNRMVVQTGNLSGTALQDAVHLINSQVKSGYNLSGGSSTLWHGFGINSSSAAADTRRITGLAVLQNNSHAFGSTDGSVSDGTGAAFLTTFDGQAVAKNDTLVKFTYMGDTDLDGVITAGDYANIDLAFAHQQTLGPQSGWANGDFDYDGQITAADYSLMDSAFAAQSGILSGEIYPLAASTNSLNSVTAVPEPGGLLLASVAAILASLVFAAIRRKRSVRGRL